MKRLLSIVAVGALAVGLVACGDDDSSGGAATTAGAAATTAAGGAETTTGGSEASTGSSEGGTEGAAAGEAAAARIQPLLEPITKIPVTEKLDAAPAKG
jgi:hypothetical protein